jgi:hypothetical protein
MAHDATLLLSIRSAPDQLSVHIKRGVEVVAQQMDIGVEREAGRVMPQPACLALAPRSNSMPVKPGLQVVERIADAYGLVLVLIVTTFVATMGGAG